MLELATAVAEWDQGNAGRPHQEILKGLTRLWRLRFQPYRNEGNPNFVERLGVWLEQFPVRDRRAAFLLASRILFVTEEQFKSLQRHLFERTIRKILHRDASRKRGASTGDFTDAESYLVQEMNNTLFVPNSDSSRISQFVHVNRRFFQNHGRRNLTAEEVGFWTYPARQARRSAGQDRVVVDACETYEKEVLARHRKIRGKSRLVILEDFSGTGSDLEKTVHDLDATDLPFDHVVLAPVVATESALSQLRSACSRMTKRRYEVVCSLLVPYEWQCFGGPGSSYLDRGLPMRNLSRQIALISDRMFAAHFSKALAGNPRYGFGDLALAVVLYANCPDNSLPIIWSEAGDWRPLFRRVSRIL